MDTLTQTLVDEPQTIRTALTRGDRVFRRTAVAAGLSTFAIMALIGTFLVLRAGLALKSQGLHFLTSTAWQPLGNPPVLGIAALMYWTVVMALIALVIAVPVSVATALFITEYAPIKVRRPLTTLIDLLAAVPSIIFGLWTLFFLQDKMLGLSAFLAHHFSFVPVFRGTSENFASSAFICGVMLALMIVPVVTSIVREVFSQAPQVEKEGALALGATRWGMIRTVILPFGRGGIVGGSMLGLGRALGETIAVAMVMSPIFKIRLGILESGSNGVAPHIALHFGEATPFELSGLMAAGLALFGLTLIVNTFAALVVSRSRSGKGVEI